PLIHDVGDRLLWCIGELSPISRDHLHLTKNSNNSLKGEGKFPEGLDANDACTEYFIGCGLVLFEHEGFEATYSQFSGTTQAGRPATHNDHICRHIHTHLSLLPSRSNAHGKQVNASAGMLPRRYRERRLTHITKAACEAMPPIKDIRPIFRSPPIE